MTPTAPADRLASLDQFRGYTVLGMLLVNFVGPFTAVRSSLPLLCHHHTYCSYADLIMPQFLFAVGFAYRLTFLRRLRSDRAPAAYGHAVRRCGALLLVAFAAYGVAGPWKTWGDTDQFLTTLNAWAKRDWMQTLAHIALASLWVLPVIAAKPKYRVAYATFSGLLHVGLSYGFNYRWVNTQPNGVDGGPLGFLTWSVPLLVGTLAYDLHEAVPGRLKYAARTAVIGTGVMAVAYGLSCLHLAPSDRDEWHFNVAASFSTPPLVHIDLKPPTDDLFTMSQRSGSLTYPLFGAGFSLVLLATFVLACDVGSFRLGVFRTFGGNALAAYLVHGFVYPAVSAFAPKDSPLWYVGLAAAVALTLCYTFVRYLENHRLYLRL